MASARNLKITLFFHADKIKSKTPTNSKVASLITKVKNFKIKYEDGELINLSKISFILTITTLENKYGVNGIGYSNKTY